MASRTAVEMEFQTAKNRNRQQKSISMQGFRITHVSPTAAVNEFGLNDSDPPFPTSMIWFIACAPAANANKDTHD